MRTLKMDRPIISSEDLYKRRNIETTIPKSERIIRKVDLFDKYDFISNNYKLSPKIPGQHFLYEKFEYRSDSIVIGYPKLGIYLNSYPCDQTIEVEWIDHRRSWEWNLKIGEYFYVAEEKSEIKHLPLWSDSLNVYGVWDKMPDWRQLKQSYERTWWFWRSPDELRDIRINRLLR